MGQLPTPDEAVRGYIGMRRVYFIHHSGTGKSYTCRECHGQIPAGESHVIQRYLKRNRDGYLHHHKHPQCVEAGALKLLTGVERIPASMAPLPKGKPRSRRFYEHRKGAK